MLLTGGTGADGVTDGSATDVPRMIVSAVAVNDRWVDDEMSVIDVGETALVQVGESKHLGLAAP